MLLERWSLEETTRVREEIMWWSAVSRMLASRLGLWMGGLERGRWKPSPGSDQDMLVDNGEETR